MTKPRPRKMYAVIEKKKPKIEYMEMYTHTDVKLGKGEEIWEVEVKAIRIIKKRVVPKKKRV